MGRVLFNKNDINIIVQVRLFNIDLTLSKRANLILDTGASHTCVAPYVINGLGYTVIGGEGKTITASGTVNKQSITLSKLVAIGESVENIDVSILKFPPEMRILNIHGLLGLDFLRHFDMKINFSSGIVEIVRIS